MILKTKQLKQHSTASNPFSISSDTEYAGMIYRRKNDPSYYYTSPNKGSTHRSYPNQSGTCPKDTYPTAYYHTHGDDNDPNYDDEHFSAEDRFASKSIKNRIDNNGVDGYLGTPKGKFIYLNRNTGNTTQLGPDGTIKTK